jgi:Flp pilus assembly protein TadG
MRLRPPFRISFARDVRAATAVEFAIIAAPFFAVLLSIFQLAIFYMTQSALNAGVILTAENLRISFTTGTTLTFPSAATLKGNVSANAGAMVPNTAATLVEIRQLVNLDAGAVPIVDGTMDTGTTTSVLVLRAQTQAFAFAPLFNSLLTVKSSAIMRRQGT